MKNLFVFIILALLSETAVQGKDIISGDWNGELKVSPQISLKIVFHFSSAPDGTPAATMDSPNQGAYDIPCEVSFLSTDSVSLMVKQIGMSYVARMHDEKLSGTFRQGPMTAPLTLMPGTIAMRRPQSPHPPYPYTTTEVIFTNPAAGAMLAGTLTIPENATDTTPVVLMVTGSGQQNRDEEVFNHKPFAVIADHLARHGIASLRYDDRGFGASSGDATAATTRDFALDAKAGLEYLRSMKQFGKTGVLGHSEGAMIAFMLGSNSNSDKDLSSNPDFIVALGAPSVQGDTILADQSATLLRMSGVPQDIVDDYYSTVISLYRTYTSSGKDAARKQIGELCANWENNPIRAKLKANLYTITDVINPWISYFISTAPDEFISGAKCPVFVAFGSKDTQINPHLNMPKMQRLAPDATVKLYDGLNHIFQHANTGAVQEYAIIEETISPELLSDISKFISTIR